MSLTKWTSQQWLDEVHRGLISLRELNPESVTRLVYGGDELGRLNFGIISRIPPGLPELSQAVTVVRVKRDHDNTWILLLTLEDAKYTDVFTDLCDYVQQKVSLASSESAGLEIAMEAFFKWRQMFQGARKQILTNEECRGLFAELEFGFSILAQRIGLSNVLESWQGPYGADQDYQVQDANFEIKSRHVATRSLRIASEYQLAGKNLTVVSMTILESAQSLEGYWSLCELVDQIQQSCITSERYLAIFEEGLEQVGFDFNEPVYKEKFFKLEAVDYYGVVDGFPRITPNFLPSGISRVNYQVDIQEIEKFRTSESSALSSLIALGEI